MNLLRTIETAWGWRGIAPTELIDRNLFGNLIVKNANGRYWRLCPEELEARPVADSVAQLKNLRADPEFAEDWKMSALAEMATSILGLPGDGRCYCLKIPAVLGGEYRPENLATIGIDELIAASGEMARQIADVSDGSSVRLTVKD